MSIKPFHIGDILTITTDRLVSPRHIQGVYDILNWMTGDELFTHQLPRASEECKPSLLQQHPDLASVVVPEDLAGEQSVAAWLAEQVKRYGETRPVVPLSPEDHTRIGPIAEFKMLRPDAEVISVELPPESP